jgi:hypothetical protein
MGAENGNKIEIRIVYISANCRGIPPPSTVRKKKTMSRKIQCNALNSTRDL